MVEPNKIGVCAPTESSSNVSSYYPESNQCRPEEVDSNVEITESELPADEKTPNDSEDKKKPSLALLALQKATDLLVDQKTQKAIKKGAELAKKHLDPEGKWEKFDQIKRDIQKANDLSPADQLIAAERIFANIQDFKLPNRQRTKQYQEKLCQSLLDLLDSAHRDSEPYSQIQARALLIRAQVYRFLNQYDLANQTEAYLEQNSPQGSESHYELLERDTQEIDHKMGEYQEELKKEEQEASLSKIKSLQEELQEKAKIQAQEARRALQKQDWAKAKIHAKAAAEIWEAMGEATRAADIQAEIPLSQARVYLEKGQFDRAMQLVSKLKKQSHDHQFSLDFGAKVYHLSYEINYAQSNYQEAWQDLKQPQFYDRGNFFNSQAIFKENLEQVAENYFEIFEEIQDFSEKERVLEELQEIYEVLGNQDGIRRVTWMAAQSHQDHAKKLKDQGKPELAAQNFQKAMDHLGKFQADAAVVLQEKFRIFHHSKDYESALLVLKELEQYGEQAAFEKNGPGFDFNSYQGHLRTLAKGLENQIEAAKDRNDLAAEGEAIHEAFRIYAILEEHGSGGNGYLRIRREYQTYIKYLQFHIESEEDELKSARENLDYSAERKSILRLHYFYDLYSRYCTMSRIKTLLPTRELAASQESERSDPKWFKEAEQNLHQKFYQKYAAWTPPSSKEEGKTKKSIEQSLMERMAELESALQAVPQNFSVTQNEKESSSPLRDVRDQLRRAMTLRAKGRQEQANHFFQRACQQLDELLTKVDPQQEALVTEVLSLRASIKDALGDYQGAARDYQNADGGQSPLETPEFSYAEEYQLQLEDILQSYPNIMEKLKQPEERIRFLEEVISIEQVLREVYQVETEPYRDELEKLHRQEVEQLQEDLEAKETQRQKQLAEDPIQWNLSRLEQAEKENNFEKAILTWMDLRVLTRAQGTPRQKRLYAQGQSILKDNTLNFLNQCDHVLASLKNQRMGQTFKNKAVVENLFKRYTRLVAQLRTYVKQEKAATLEEAVEVLSQDSSKSKIYQDYLDLMNDVRYRRDGYFKKFFEQGFRQGLAKRIDPDKRQAADLEQAQFFRSGLWHGQGSDHIAGEAYLRVLDPVLQTEMQKVESQQAAKIQAHRDKYSLIILNKLQQEYHRQTGRPGDSNLIRAQHKQVLDILTKQYTYQLALENLEEKYSKYRYLWSDSQETFFNRVKAVYGLNNIKEMREVVAWLEYEDMMDPTDQWTNFSDESCRKIIDEAVLQAVSAGVSMGFVTYGRAVFTGSRWALSASGGASRLGRVGRFLTSRPMTYGMTNTLDNTIQSFTTMSLTDEDFSTELERNARNTVAFDLGAWGWQGLIGSVLLKRRYGRALNLMGVLGTQTFVATGMSYAEDAIAKQNNPQKFWERFGGSALRMTFGHMLNTGLRKFTPIGKIEANYYQQRQIRDQLVQQHGLNAVQANELATQPETLKSYDQHLNNHLTPQMAYHLATHPEDQAAFREQGELFQKNLGEGMSPQEALKKTEAWFEKKYGPAKQPEKIKLSKKEKAEITRQVQESVALVWQKRAEDFSSHFTLEPNAERSTQLFEAALEIAEQKGLDLRRPADLNAVLHSSAFQKVELHSFYTDAVARVNQEEKTLNHLRSEQPGSQSFFSRLKLPKLWVMAGGASLLFPKIAEASSMGADGVLSMMPGDSSLLGMTLMLGSVVGSGWWSGGHQQRLRQNIEHAFSSEHLDLPESKQPKRERKFIKDLQKQAAKNRVSPEEMTAVLKGEKPFPSWLQELIVTHQRGLTADDPFGQFLMAFEQFGSTDFSVLANFQNSQHRGSPQNLSAEKKENHKLMQQKEVRQRANTQWQHVPISVLTSVVAGDHESRNFSISHWDANDANFEIGRKPDNIGRKIEDRYVSRKHFNFERREDGIYLIPKSQKKVTYLNGSLVREPIKMVPGDHVQIRGQNGIYYNFTLESRIPKSSAQLEVELHTVEKQVIRDDKITYGPEMFEKGVGLKYPIESKPAPEHFNASLQGVFHSKEKTNRARVDELWNHFQVGAEVEGQWFYPLGQQFKQVRRVASVGEKKAFQIYQDNQKFPPVSLEAAKLAWDQLQNQMRSREIDLYFFVERDGVFTAVKQLRNQEIASNKDQIAYFGKLVENTSNLLFKNSNLKQIYINRPMDHVRYNLDTTMNIYMPTGRQTLMSDWNLQLANLSTQIKDPGSTKKDLSSHKSIAGFSSKDHQVIEADYQILKEENALPAFGVILGLNKDRAFSSLLSDSFVSNLTVYQVKHHQQGKIQEGLDFFIEKIDQDPKIPNKNRVKAAFRRIYFRLARTNCGVDFYSDTLRQVKDFANSAVSYREQPPSDRQLRDFVEDGGIWLYNLSRQDERSAHVLYSAQFKGKTGFKIAKLSELIRIAESEVSLELQMIEQGQKKEVDAARKLTARPHAYHDVNAYLQEHQIALWVDAQGQFHHDNTSVQTTHGPLAQGLREKNIVNGQGVMGLYPTKVQQQRLNIDVELDVKPTRKDLLREARLKGASELGVKRNQGARRWRVMTNFDPTSFRNFEGDFVQGHTHLPVTLENSDGNRKESMTYTPDPADLQHLRQEVARRRQRGEKTNIAIYIHTETLAGQPMTMAAQVIDQNRVRLHYHIDELGPSFSVVLDQTQIPKFEGELTSLLIKTSQGLVAHSDLTNLLNKYQGRQKSRSIDSPEVQQKLAELASPQLPRGMESLPAHEANQVSERFSKHLDQQEEKRAERGLHLAKPVQEKLRRAVREKAMILAAYMKLDIRNESDFNKLTQSTEFRTLEEALFHRELLLHGEDLGTQPGVPELKRQVENNLSFIKSLERARESGRHFFPFEIHMAKLTVENAALLKIRSQVEERFPISSKNFRAANQFRSRMVQLAFKKFQERDASHIESQPRESNKNNPVHSYVSGPTKLKSVDLQKLVNPEEYHILSKLFEYESNPHFSAYFYGENWKSQYQAVLHKARSLATKYRLDFHLDRLEETFLIAEAEVKSGKVSFEDPKYASQMPPVMDPIVKRIQEAISKKDTLTVFGDIRAAAQAFLRLSNSDQFAFSKTIGEILDGAFENFSNLDQQHAAITALETLNVIAPAIKPPSIKEGLLIKASRFLEDSNELIRQTAQRAVLQEPTNLDVPISSVTQHWMPLGRYSTGPKGVDAWQISTRLFIHPGQIDQTRFDSVNSNKGSELSSTKLPEEAADLTQIDSQKVLVEVLMGNISLSETRLAELDPQTLFNLIDQLPEDIGELGNPVTRVILNDRIGSLKSWAYGSILHSLEADHLNDLELAAVDAYHGDSSLANASLRGASDRNIKDTSKKTQTEIDMEKAEKAHIFLLDHAIEKTPAVPKSMTVYRGEVFGDIIRDDGTQYTRPIYQVGDEFNTEGFLSTSAKKSVATRFADQAEATKRGGIPVVMMIRLKPGQKGLYLGNQGYDHEAEFLLPRDTKLRVVVSEKRDGVIYQTLEVVETIPSYLRGDEKVIGELEAAGNSEVNLVEINGRKFSKKKSEDGDINHLWNEYYANQAYQRLGVPVAKVFVKDGFLYSEYFENSRTYNEFMEDPKITEQSKAKIQKQVQEHFAADALLGNWDVIGRNRNNILIVFDPKKGYRAVRINHSGALRYHEGGSLKGSKFAYQVKETDAMRDPEVNPSAAEVFKDLSQEEIQRQIDQLPDDIGKIGSPALNHIINQRIRDLKGKPVEEIKLEDLNPFPKELFTSEKLQDMTIELNNVLKDLGLD